jgi:hypothetical protein
MHACHPRYLKTEIGRIKSRMAQEKYVSCCSKKIIAKAKRAADVV